MYIVSSSEIRECGADILSDHANQTNPSTVSENFLQHVMLLLAKHYKAERFRSLRRTAASSFAKCVIARAGTFTGSGLCTRSVTLFAILSPPITKPSKVRCCGPGTVSCLKPIKFSRDWQMAFWRKQEHLNILAQLRDGEILIIIET